MFRNFKPNYILGGLLIWIIAVNCDNARNDDLDRVNSTDHNIQFSDFIQTALKNYSNWIQSRNMDPSPPKVDTISLSDSDSSSPFQVDFKIINESISGYSVETDETSSFGKGNLTEKYISIKRSSNITFIGDYIVNGTIIEDVQFKGHGRFVMKPQRLCVENLIYRNFENDMNYINLTSAAITFFSPPSVFGDVMFENIEVLPDEGFPPLYDNKSLIQAIEGKLSGLYSNYLSDSQDPKRNPSIRMLDQYLHTVFTETPLSRIITTAKPKPHEQPKVVKNVTSDVIIPVNVTSENDNSPIPEPETTLFMSLTGSTFNDTSGPSNSSDTDIQNTSPNKGNAFKLDLCIFLSLLYAAFFIPN